MANLNNMKDYIKIAIVTILFTLFTYSSFAQNDFGGIISFDKTIHNFGDIKISDGPKECSFRYKNISKKPIVIHNIITSCGCTDPIWKRKPIMPGESETIKIIFKNDQGPYPFDKGIIIYVSDLSKPVILRIRGIAHAKKKALEELYPIKIGQIGLREAVFKIGNLEQGLSRTETFSIANLSNKAANISFTDKSPELSIEITPNPIPARSKADITCIVNTKNSREKNWGNTRFNANILVNGNKQSRKIEIEALIKENFNNISEDQRRKGSLPQIDASSIELPTCNAGEKFSRTFTFKNIGKDNFIIYKAQCEEKGVSFEYTAETPYQKNGKINVNIDTKGHKGEMLYIITLITNSPMRPIITLFITGNIK